MSFWGRRRDIALLIAVVVLQLILLGYQVRHEDDMTLLRAWAVGAVSPVNKLLHGVFSSGSDAWNHYIWLVGARRENDDRRREIDRLRIENDDLRRNLERFGRESELIAYQDRTASETLLAEVIGGGANSHAREIILNRGRRDGVLPGMAVVTADGIVGKVQAAYQGSSLVLLISDADSGVGVILGDSRVRGILKGRGTRELLVDYVAHEVAVSVGETLYTSGDDRVYPKGLRVGRVTRLKRGADFLEIYVEPFAALDRLDETLIVKAGVHEILPARRRPQISETLLPLPLEAPAPAARSPGQSAPSAPEPDSTLNDPRLTDADRLKQRYRAIADAQGVRLGETNPGGRTPDFNLGHPSSSVPAAPETGPLDPPRTRGLERSP